MKQVLIAHQSTIPHYRVDFYNELERLRPDWWQFKVVYDGQGGEQDVQKTAVFQFPILPTKRYTLRNGRKPVIYQPFWRQAAQHDLLIVENAINNLVYPLCHLHQLRGKRIAYWGHGKHWDAAPSRGKQLTEGLKLFLSRRANGFFAYTEPVKGFLVDEGVAADKVFVLNNTIDIMAQRAAFDRFWPQRDEIRARLGLTDKRVLLFVGRFSQGKRIDFLLSAFQQLHQQDENVHLLLVGRGGEAYGVNDMAGVTYFGPVLDLEGLAPIYVASDLLAYPGLVGLGPLQALCYDLPVVTIASPQHKPEIAYLAPDNSLILPKGTGVDVFTAVLTDLLANEQKLTQWRQAIWPTISHLTLQQMAQNFINGVNHILS